MWKQKKKKCGRNILGLIDMMCCSFPLKKKKDSKLRASKLVERGECLSAEKGRKEEELGSDMHEMKAVKKWLFTW